MADGAPPAPGEPPEQPDQDVILRAHGSRLSDLTDEELVERAQSGNSRAFEMLLRRHQRAMFGTSLRLLSRDGDAEDAVQEAFIASWRRFQCLSWISSTRSLSSCSVILASCFWWQPRQAFLRLSTGLRTQ